MILQRIIVTIGVILGSLFGIGFASGYDFIFPPEIQGSGVLASVFLEEKNLNSTVIVYRSRSDLEAYKVMSFTCDIRSRFLDSRKDLYFFSLDFSKASGCKDEQVYLSYKGNIVEESMQDISFSDFHAETLIFLDYSSEDLVIFQDRLKQDMKQYALYASYQGTRIAKYYRYFQKQRKYFESLRKIEVISEILEKREKKYISPVKGKTISEAFTKIPNSPRPYRAEYTDGIHHGWDIDTYLGENVISLDDGYIIRIVSGFDNTTDFNRIEYGDTLSEEQKAKNLDVLRGNQVWLKTMKGEVVFYSHLASVNTALFEGKFVHEGTILGTVGITGVPGDDYDDYHLHFPIMKNPYNKDKAGTYEFTEYMFWDWLTKGLDHHETVEAQKDIFK